MFPVTALEIRDDDTEFMEKVYYTYRGCMYKEARHFFGSKHDIEDVMDATLEALIRNMSILRQLDDGRRYLYIIRATRHNAINLLRHQRRHAADLFHAVNVDIPSGAPDIDDFLMYQAEIDSVRRALKKLHAGEEKILRMKYFEGKSDEEIGLEFGIKGSTVRSRIRRARESLRKLLVEEDDSYG